MLFHRIFHPENTSILRGKPKLYVLEKVIAAISFYYYRQLSLSKHKTNKEKCKQKLDIT